MPARSRLLIIQPYVPRYRVPFFRALVDELARSGIACVVRAAAPPDQDQRLRGDGAQEPFMLPGRRREVNVAGRNLTARGSRASRRYADAVITGLSATSPDTWAALAARRPTGTPVGVWGHVGTYVSSTSTRAQGLRRWQTRHADHVFAYTPGGAEQALQWGVPPARITTVMNTVDVAAITRACMDIDPREVDRFRRERDLFGRPTAAYIGGLDGAKRIPLLAEALDHLWREEPDFRLILGGRGSERALLDRAVVRGQVIDLGFVGDREKALIAGAATALAMPGRIGLVAVEALALGLPVVTMHDAVHAPEREYLPPDWLHVTPDGGAARYAAELLAVTTTAAHRRSVRPEIPDLGDMVANFAGGCRTLLGR